MSRSLLVRVLPSSAQSCVNEEPFELYFKGLIGDERVFEGSKRVSVAAVGAAVYDPQGHVVWKVQKPLLGDWKSDWEDNLDLKVELKALIKVLTTALSLDIKRIAMRWLVKQQKIATLVHQVCLLQRKFYSCQPFLVAREDFVAQKDVKFAFKLARDAIESQITRSAESSCAKSVMETCSICLEDIGIGQMFSVNGCLHCYCFSCMKQHVEVKLLNGMLPTCPHECCNSKLDIHSSKKFLSPELVDMMIIQLKEDSIPVTQKLCCPFPQSSMVMSKDEAPECVKNLSASSGQSGLRKCIKCGSFFCINCKVPWHSDMTCLEYKSLNPHPTDAKLKSLATQRLWRQCIKCSHMIEPAEGCYHITCRCDYEFCYTCGAEWRNKKATCSCPI